MMERRWELGSDKFLSGDFEVNFGVVGNFTEVAG